MPHHCDLPWLYVSTPATFIPARARLSVWSLFIQDGKVIGGAPLGMWVWRRLGKPTAREFCRILRERGARLERINP